MAFDPLQQLQRAEFRESQRLAAATHGVVVVRPPLPPGSTMLHLHTRLRVCANPEVLSAGGGGGKSSSSGTSAQSGRAKTGADASDGAATARTKAAAAAAGGGARPAWDSYGARLRRW